MRITIDFNGLGEIHAPNHQSEVEKRVIEAVVEKLPREIQKVEYEIQKLNELKWYLEDMHKDIKKLDGCDVVINYLTR